MMTRLFWKQALERALKSFAQSLLLAIGASGVGANLFALDLKTLVGFGVGGMVLSVLTSIASAPFGATNSPSLVNTTAAPTGTPATVTAPGTPVPR